MGKLLKLSVYFIFFICSFQTFSQDLKEVYELDELIIEPKKIFSRSKSQNLIVFNDSILNTTTGTFTDFLQKKTTIYFKENGPGMVSSPSFRGTTAQQTSVLWNGIRVNSNLLGQSDFNSTSFKNYDDITIKAGGGSVLYGSGAVGGTIHLNNNLQYQFPLQQTVQLGYGSFTTQALHYKIKAGNNKLAVNAHVGYNQSENDYKWQKQNRKNLNGNYYNFNFGTELGYLLNLHHTLEYYNAFYTDDRSFSLITPFQTETKYLNNHYRNLFKWHYNKSNWKNSLYIGNIQEHYTFYDQLPSASNTGGKSNMWLFKNENFYQINEQFKLGSLVEYQMTNAKGSNDNLPKTSQQIASIALQGYYNFNNQGFELGLKNEYAKDYSNPFLFSLGYFFNTSNYQLKINASKNYRIPTFNDLYWQPGGNLDLKPETSFQIDVNQNVKLNDFNFNLSAYYIEIQNMLRWLPTNTGMWKATNTTKVITKGIEVALQYEEQWKNHQLQFNSNLSYNLATNENSSKQLTYTPKLKSNASVAYTFNGFTLAPSFSHIGKIFTTESNTIDSVLDSYILLDIYIAKTLFSKKWPITVSLQVKNILNTSYYSMPEREMPGTNYHLTLTKKL